MSASVSCNSHFKHRTRSDVAEKIARNTAESFYFDVSRPVLPVSCSAERAVGEALAVHREDLFAVYSAQGKVRPDMQDAWSATQLNVKIAGASVCIPCYCVFDGHGDRCSAQHLAAHLSDEIGRQIEARCEDGFTDKALWNSFKRACLNLNDQICASYDSGSTAIVCLLIDHVLWTINVGDSRAILSTEAGFVGLSRDQTIAQCAQIGTSKMTALSSLRRRPLHANGAERDFMRIARRGGTIIDGYVRSQSVLFSKGLNMPRAFGNRTIAANGIRVLTAKPEITRVAMTPSASQILILGCDGVWDCISSQQLSQEAQALHAQKYALSKICRILGRHVAGAPRQQDNVTLLMVDLSRYL